MLELKTFISGMTTLQKCYIGWQFDTKDQMQVAIWYAPFKNLSDERFKKLIKDYYTHNRQPPKSVMELKQPLVDEVYENAKIKPEMALSFVREIISNRGGWQFEGRAEIYQDLKPYPELYETVRELEDELRELKIGDSYFPNRFRETYAIKLRMGAMRFIDKELGLFLPSGEKKVLGSGTLPYEE